MASTFVESILTEGSFMGKPAITMNLGEFVEALNLERDLNQEIEQALLEKGFFGKVTPSVIRQLKPANFNRFGELTLEGEIDIIRDLKRAGLPKNATIKGYMTHAVLSIRCASMPL